MRNLKTDSMNKERKTYKGKETAKIKIQNEKNEKVKQ